MPKSKAKNRKLPLLIALVLVTLLFLIMYSVSRKVDHVISGVNFYFEPIILKIDDEQIHVSPFEMYSITKRSLNNKKIEIYNRNGELLDEISHSPMNRLQNNYSIDILSEGSKIKNCFAAFDVTGVMYGTGDPKYISSLSHERVSSIDFALAGDPRLILHPNKYHPLNLPLDINDTQKVTGVYPVTCDYLGSDDDINKKELIEEVLWWSNYNAQVQRQLYEDKIEDAESSPEYSI